MKKFMAGMFVGLILALPVGGLAAQRVFDESLGLGKDGMDRFDDADFQVKCWKYTERRESGISCLPWSQVKER